MNKAYGPNAPCCATIFLSLKKFREGKTDIDDELRGGRPTIDAYASTHRLKELIGIKQSLVWKILTSDLHFKLHFCKWVPYKITDGIQQKRVEMAQSMLNVLTSEKISHNDIITGDESWFYWSYEQTPIWLPETSNSPLIPKPTIGMKPPLFHLFQQNRNNPHR